MSEVEAKSDALFGDREWLVISLDGEDAVLSATKMSELGIAPASVTTKRGTYIIERSLLCETKGGQLIIRRVRETVSGSGRYAREELSTKPAQNSPGVNWRIRKAR
jgi:hypothetical protein